MEGEVPQAPPERWSMSNIPMYDRVAQDGVDVAIWVDVQIFFPGHSWLDVFHGLIFQTGRPMVLIACFKSSPSLGLH